QRPCDGDFTCGASVARADGAEELGEVEVLRQQRFLIVRGAPAEVVFGHIRYAFARHRATEHAGLHGRVGNHADVVGAAVRQDRLFDLGRDDVVGRLQRSDGRDFRDARHLGGVEVADADVAHLAGFPQLFAGGPAFFDVFLGLRPVDLVEIDGVDVEAAKAVLAFFEDGGLFEALVDDAVRPPAPLALGEDVRLLREAFEGAADDFFGMPETVYGGGVDPVDAFIESRVNRVDGSVVILRAPGECPTGAAHGPRADSEGSDVKIAVSQPSGLHREYGIVCRVLSSFM